MVELRPSRPGVHEIRRIARAQIGAALKSLTGTAITDEAIHLARKELKKARASLRLLRDAFGEACYERENAALRDAARPLSEIRDSVVLIQSLDELVALYGAAARALPLEVLHRRMRRERADLRHRAQQGMGALSMPRKSLREIKSRAAHWHVGHKGWSVIGVGLKRVYAQGRRSFATAQTTCSSQTFHECRKQGKYLLYQLQILKPLKPAIIGELADRTRQFTGYLGDDHDLAILRAKLLEYEAALPKEARSALIALIDRRRAELEDKAIILGRRLYEEKPRAFAARFGRYWHHWKNG